MQNKLRIIISIILIGLCSISNGIAQPPPPPPISSTYVKDGKTLPIRMITKELMDSINNMKVSSKEIATYLKHRPAFGDTTGKTKDIYKIIKNAKVGIIYGFYKDYNSGILAAEENYRVRNMVDKVLVVKHERKMYLQKNGKTIKSFKIALGPHPVGQKEKEGDGKTPEGVYSINWTKWNGNTPSFHLSYPNDVDKQRAATKKLTPGSNIMIHNTTKGIKKSKDWTNGCIALSNVDFEVFRKMVFQDTRVEIIK